MVGIFAPTVERLTLSLEDGTLVRYGAAESLAAKNEVLLSLLAELAREGTQAAYIDVRVPTSPAVSTSPFAGVTSPPPDPSTSTTATSGEGDEGTDAAATEADPDATPTPTPAPTSSDT